MILITGATGQYGKITIDFLLAKGVQANKISALVRDENKAEDLKAKGISLKIGDYDNYNSLVEAFKEVDKLLLISGSDIVNRVKQQENAVNAAKEAGVKHIIYTSFERKNETSSSPIALVAEAHIDTEKNIKASGIPFTILKNNLYMDLVPAFAGEKVLETGVFLPAGEGKTSFTARADMAEATANILIEQGHSNKEYSFSNTENVSFQDIANILSDISGTAVSYYSPTGEVYIETLTKAGVPVEFAGMFAGFAEAIKQGEFENSSSDLESLLGRKPTPIKEFLKEIYKS